MRMIRIIKGHPLPRVVLTAMSVGRVVLFHRYPRADDAGRGDAARAARVRDGADDGADHRHPLVDAVRPRADDVADVVVDPLLAAHDARPLEAHGEGVAVGGRALEVELPAR